MKVIGEVEGVINQVREGSLSIKIARDAYINLPKTLLVNKDKMKIGQPVKLVTSEVKGKYFHELIPIEKREKWERASFGGK